MRRRWRRTYNRIGVYRVNSHLRVQWSRALTSPASTSREPSRVILTADGPVVFQDEPGSLFFSRFSFFFLAEPPGSRAPLLDWNVPFEPPPPPHYPQPLAMPLAHTPSPTLQPPLCMAKPWMHDSIETLRSCLQIFVTFTFFFFSFRRKVAADVTALTAFSSCRRFGPLRYGERPSVLSMPK